MLEKIEHKVIDPRECPRCHGHNTSRAECDYESSIITYLCHDCEAKDPYGERDGFYYDIVLVDVVESVRWATEDATVEHEIPDTEYLAMLAAKDLLEVAVLFEDLTRNGIQPGSEDLERLQNVIAKAKGEAHE